MRGIKSRSDHRHPRQSDRTRGRTGADRRLGHRGIYCGGDLVGYGPWPDEVCELIARGAESRRSTATTTTRSGGTRRTAGARTRARGSRPGAALRRMDPRAHRPGSKDSCASFRSTCGSSRRPARVRLVHGSPRKVNEYLFEDKPARAFERIAAGSRRRVLVFGHTHKPWIHEYGGVSSLTAARSASPKTAIPGSASRSCRPRPREARHGSSASATTPSTPPARSRPRGCRANTPRSSWRPDDDGDLDVNRPPLARRLFAEFLGTAFLVAVVVGSGIAAQQLSPDDVGLQLLENAAATGGGAVHDHPHVRPGLRRALQPGRLAGRRGFGGLRWRDALAYIPAQVFGCIAGAIVANAMFALAAVSSRPSTARRGASVRGGDRHARAGPGDLRPRAHRPRRDRAGRGGRLHRRRVLLHQLDELRQPGGHHRPHVLRHLRRHRPGSVPAFVVASWSAARSRSAC